MLPALCCKRTPGAFATVLGEWGDLGRFSDALMHAGEVEHPRRRLARGRGTAFPTRSKTLTRLAPARSAPVEGCMLPLLALVFPVAAIGFSLIYLLLGGGFGGAIVIFIIAKLLGK